MIPIPKRPRATRTLAVAVADQILDALGAKDVPAELEHRVANIGVADGADGEFLHTQNELATTPPHTHVEG